MKIFQGKITRYLLLYFLVLGSNQATASDCINCHSEVLKQLSGKSHHIQGGNISGKNCYACHWEATKEGKTNSRYHNVYAVKKSAGSMSSPVDLVVWVGGKRPTNYKIGSTAVTFVKSAIETTSERSEVAKVTNHCLGCHSDQTSGIKTFIGDNNLPIKYAWDGQSVASRYSQKGVTTWGKYSSIGGNKKHQVVKAFSAHGNATANQGGWNPTEGYDGSILNSRSGDKNVECFDCHNSHGSNVSGVTSSYRSFDGSYSGALLKETVAGKGGYKISYTPSVNSYQKSNNPFNAGAGLCFDCHETPESGKTPWGFKSTFGAEQAVVGYKDSPGFGSGSKGSTARFAQRHSRSDVASSHLKAGQSLNHMAEGEINGLCTPCHDPHGVSRTLGDKMQYAVPMLKDSWLTSPYREDGPPLTPVGAGSEQNKNNRVDQSGKDDKKNYNSVNRDASVNFGKGASSAAKSDYNAVNRAASANFGKGESGAARQDDYNLVNREASANFGKGSSTVARDSDYNLVNREASVNFGKGASSAAKSDYNAVNRAASANFGKGESGAARQDDYNLVNREASANFGKGASTVARDSDYNVVNREASVNFGKGASAAAREIDSNKQNRDSGSNFAKGGNGAPREPMKGMKYNVDQNTFGGNSRIKENDAEFAGICLKCHKKENLTGNTSVGDVHRTVKGWGKNKEHSFPCSKCHQSHSSGLPRLMQTNCFEQGPIGLRENSGVPWLPYKNGGINQQPRNTQNDSNANDSSATNTKVVGCHVKQFGKATAVSSKGDERNGQWKEVSKW